MVSSEALKKLQEQVAAWPITQRFVVQQLIEDYLDIREDLLAYKNTGLTPEQCENAKVIIEVAFSDDTSKAERIRELLKADKDGRLVVLPCKVGDTVIDQTFAENPRLMKNTRLEIAYESRCGIIFHMGYDIFADLVEHGRIKPVSEEAEKALEAMKDA